MGRYVGAYCFHIYTQASQDLLEADLEDGFLALFTECQMAK